MKISVFGLGYVGCVSAAGFAARGHTVVGVDVNALKVRLIEAGQTPVLEAGLGESVAASVRNGRLSGKTDGTAAVGSDDLSLVCVGTPSTSSGGLSTDALERVARVIGRALAHVDRRHTAVTRSTRLPGTCEQLVVPLLEAGSRRRAGDDFGVAVDPEFLREGTSHRVSLRVAEMTKCPDNALTRAEGGLRQRNRRRLPCIRTRLPRGYADLPVRQEAEHLAGVPDTGLRLRRVGLPKNLRALLYAARHADVELPILKRVLPSNKRHLQRMVDIVVEMGFRIGLSTPEAIDALAQTNGRRVVDVIRLPDAVARRGREDYVGVAW